MTSFREVRPGTSADASALADVFFLGVREGAAPKYSDAQRKAWLPARPDPGAFADRLRDQLVVVAEEQDRITGFMTLTEDGTLDLAYVLPDERGRGTAGALLAVLENQARARGFDSIHARASEMAKPFLLRNGWTISGAATQVRDGVSLPASDMSRKF